MSVDFFEYLMDEDPEKTLGALVAEIDCEDPFYNSLAEVVRECGEECTIRAFFEDYIGV